MRERSLTSAYFTCSPHISAIRVWVSDHENNNKVSDRALLTTKSKICSVIDNQTFIFPTSPMELQPQFWGWVLPQWWVLKINPHATVTFVWWFGRYWRLTLFDAPCISLPRNWRLQTMNKPQKTACVCAATVGVICLLHSITFNRCPANRNRSAVPAASFLACLCPPPISLFFFPSLPYVRVCVAGWQVALV